MGFEAQGSHTGSAAHPSPQEREESSGDLLEFDDREVLPVAEERNKQLKSRAGSTTNGRLWGSTSAFHGPALSRFEARFLMCRFENPIDFLRRSSVKEAVRPVFVIPGYVPAGLLAHLSGRKRHEDVSSTLILEREDKAFDNRNTAVLTHSAETWFNAALAAPVPEPVAEELPAVVAHKMLRSRTDSTNSSPENGADL